MTVEAEESADMAVCKANLEEFKEPIKIKDILQQLFVKFNRKDDRGNELKFTTDDIRLSGGEVEFDNPRLNGKVIDYREGGCARTKKNIFGYEVCQEISSKEVADSLCKQLGLPGASEVDPLGEPERVANTSEGLAYRLDSGKWYSLKLWSALSPRIYYTRLKALRCRLY